MFVYTSISNQFVTKGGHYEVAALQARAALTDRFAFIATKDGYIWLRLRDRVTAISLSGLMKRLAETA